MTPVQKPPVTPFTYQEVDSATTLQCEQSFQKFVEEAWHVLEPHTRFVPGIHVDAICEHLQAVSEGKIRDLVVNVPPGSAKSLLTCVFWQAWVWGPSNKPETRWITSSYRADLAIRDSVKCRTLIDSRWYQQRWGDRFRIIPGQDQKTRWENNHTGYRIAMGALSGTGERADVVVTDDPQSREQAESDLQRTSANEWWSQTMHNRVNDLATGNHVVIQQRLHEDDLTGHLKAKGGSHYEFLVLPEEFEPDFRSETSIGWKDPRTKAGELLWPAKISATDVEDLKLNLGAYAYSGQYQQRPAPATGGIFKRWQFRYWKPKMMEVAPVLQRLADGSMAKIIAEDVPDEFDEMIQSWDTAFRVLDTADFVAGGVWGAKGPKRYLLDQKHGRFEFPEICSAIKLMLRRWPKIKATLIEDAANGSAIISSLRSQIQGVIPIKPLGGKVARAHAISPQVEAGNVYLPHPAVAPWVGEFVEECAKFPNGLHDDQVDQMTQALLRLKTKVTMPSAPFVPKTPTGERSWMA